MKKTIFILTVLMLLFCYAAFPAMSADIVLSENYPFPENVEFPPVLNVGQVLECGSYRFQFLTQPVLAKSFQGLVADNDLKYLVMRVGITNTGEETVGWLSPDSFILDEIYRNRIYGTYRLDYLMSAKAAAGFSWKAFYSSMAAGETLPTLLVFEVFPENDGWIFTLSPHVFGESSAETVSFRLPKPLVQ